MHGARRNFAAYTKISPFQIGFYLDTEVESLGENTGQNPGIREVSVENYLGFCKLKLGGEKWIFVSIITKAT